MPSHAAYLPGCKGDAFSNIETHATCTKQRKEVNVLFVFSMVGSSLLETKSWLLFCFVTWHAGGCWVAFSPAAQQPCRSAWTTGRAAFWWVLGVELLLPFLVPLKNHLQWVCVLGSVKLGCACWRLSHLAFAHSLWRKRGRASWEPRTCHCQIPVQNPFYLWGIAFLLRWAAVLCILTSGQGWGSSGHPLRQGSVVHVCAAVIKRLLQLPCLRYWMGWQLRLIRAYWSKPAVHKVFQECWNHCCFVMDGSSQERILFLSYKI